MVKLLVASTNRKKLKEMQDLLSDLDLEMICLGDLPAYEEVPETGRSFRDNAVQKALGYAQQTGLLTLAEDSGLCCDALGGEPGIYSARFAGEDKDDARNNQKVLRLLENVSTENRGARFISAVAIALPDRLLGAVEGKVEGRIDREVRGANGFGYDPIFFYPSYGLTFGQVSGERKHTVSHRAEALRKAKKLLAEFLTSSGN